MIKLEAVIYSKSGEQIALDISNKISSANLSVLDRSDFSNISFGIVSSKSSIEILDKNEIIYNLLLAKKLTGNEKAEIYIYNTVIKSKKEKITSRFATNYNYDNLNHIVSFDLVDLLTQWQEIHIPTIDTIFRKEENIRNKTYKDVYEDLYNLTPKQYNMLSFSELDENTKQILENRHINFYRRDENNLWAGWNALAKASLSHIFFDKNGRTIFRYNFGD